MANARANTPKTRKRANAKASVPPDPKSKPKRRPGRPTQYDPSLCARVIALGAQGKSKTQIAATLGHPRQVLHQWCEIHPEFADATKRAKELEQEWWENMGQSSLRAKGFNATLFIFQMKNRFREDYGDRIHATFDEAQLGAVVSSFGGNLDALRRARAAAAAADPASSEE